MKKICQEDTGTSAKGMGRIYIDVKEGIISGQDRSKWRIEIGRKKKKSYVPGAGNRRNSEHCSFICLILYFTIVDAQNTSLSEQRKVIIFLPKIICHSVNTWTEDSFVLRKYESIKLPQTWNVRLLSYLNDRQYY